MSNHYFTVVYKGVLPGEEARKLGEHPKAAALAWSHMMHERDELSRQLHDQQQQMAAVNERIIQLEQQLNKMKAERDDADRRAGAAERQLANANDSISARQSWLRRAKKDWGVSDNVSFDVVWAEALALRAKLSET